MSYAMRPCTLLRSAFKTQLPRTFSRGISQKTYTLNNGSKLPAIGYGTFQDKDQQESAVFKALNAGYGHIDTAKV